MKVRLIFAWYDIWVGLFVDQAKRRIYAFPIPCVGVVIDLPARSALSTPMGEKEKGPSSDQGAAS